MFTGAWEVLDAQLSHLTLHTRLCGGPPSLHLLTTQGPPEWHPAPEPLKQAAAAAAAAAAARGVSLPRLAIMEAVKDPAIATHLVGFCTRQQVRGLLNGSRGWAAGAAR